MEVVIGIFIVVIICMYIVKANNNGYSSNENNEERQELLKKYYDILEENQQEIEKIKKGKWIENGFDITSEDDRKNGLTDGRLGYSFIKNNTLSFLEEVIEFSNPNKISVEVLKEGTQKPIKINIKLENIKYYTINGDVETIQEINGTGGGSSLGGAIVGGIVAGSTGAIIGSRKGIDINTTNRKVDERELVIKTMDNKKYIFYNLELYEWLFDIIPEKEYEVYKKNLMNNDNKQASNNNISQLEHLAELKEKGIITEKEFEESKKKILANI